MNENWNQVIDIVQLPIIQEKLRYLKRSIDNRVSNATSLICTEETVKFVKEERAAIKKEFSELEAQRKLIKSSIMRPYEEFEKTYKECISEPYIAADKLLKKKIENVEDEQKFRCEEGLREYFKELCAAYRINWLTYEMSGVKIDLASAKAKTPTKLRKQLSEFVIHISEEIKKISSMENSDEIMYEFQRNLNLSESKKTVLDRHNAIKSNISEKKEKTEYLEPPTIKHEKEDIDDILYKCVFTVYARKEQLIKIKEFLKKEGIQYE